MKRWLVALALTVPAAVAGGLTACGSFGGDADPASASDGGSEAATPSEGSTVDGPLDAAARDAATPCATRTDAPLMCADFDESPTPLFYLSGIGSPVPGVANRNVASPGKSAPNAMWSDGTTAAVKELGVNGNEVATHVHVELDVNVDKYAATTVDGALVRVGIDPSQCYVDVVIQSDGLLFQTHCTYTDDAGDGGGFYDWTPFLQAQLAENKWWHLDLDVDYAKAQAFVTLDGSLKAQLGLNPSAKPGGKPFVRIGGISGARVGFDNVLATASK